MYFALDANTIMFPASSRFICQIAQASREFVRCDAVASHFFVARDSHHRGPDGRTLLLTVCSSHHSSASPAFWSPISLDDYTVLFVLSR